MRLTSGAWPWSSPEPAISGTEPGAVAWSLGVLNPWPRTGNCRMGKLPSSFPPPPRLIPTCGVPCAVRWVRCFSRRSGVCGRSHLVALLVQLVGSARSAEVLRVMGPPGRRSTLFGQHGQDQPRKRMERGDSPWTGGFPRRGDSRACGRSALRDRDCARMEAPGRMGLSRVARG